MKDQCVNYLVRKRVLFVEKNSDEQRIRSWKLVSKLTSVVKQTHRLTRVFHVR